MQFTQENLIASLQKVETLRREVVHLQAMVANLEDKLTKHEQLVESAHTPWLNSKS